MRYLAPAVLLIACGTPASTPDTTKRSSSRGEAEASGCPDISPVVTKLRARHLEGDGIPAGDPRVVTCEPIGKGEVFVAAIVSRIDSESGELYSLYRFIAKASGELVFALDEGVEEPLFLRVTHTLIDVDGDGKRDIVERRQTTEGVSVWIDVLDHGAGESKRAQLPTGDPDAECTATVTPVEVGGRAVFDISSESSAGGEPTDPELASLDGNECLHGEFRLAFAGGKFELSARKSE